MDGHGVGVAWDEIQEVQGGDVFRDRARLDDDAVLETGSDRIFINPSSIAPLHIHPSIHEAVNPSTFCLVINRN